MRKILSGPLARLTMAGLLSIPAGCGDAPDPRGSIHDLITLSSDASGARMDIEGLERYGDLSLLSVERHDNRDGVVFLRARPGTALVFRDLKTRGRAVLRFGCGTTRWNPAPDDGAPLRFIVEVRETGGSGTDPADPAFRTLFDEALAPGDLPLDRGYLDFERTLAETGDRNFTVRFRCEADDPSARKAKWPGWRAPTLLSEGRPESSEPLPAERVTPAVDLLRRFSAADRSGRSGKNGPRRAEIGLDTGLVAGGGERPALLIPAPGRVTFVLDLPPRARLAFDAGVLDPARSRKKSGSRDPGGPDDARAVTSRIRIDGEVIRRDVTDAARAGKRPVWVPRTVDLTAYGGRRVRLDLIVEAEGPGPTLTCAFARPRIESVETIPRLEEDPAPLVLFLVAETLRADRSMLFGGGEDLMPRLDALARKGVAFTRARSVSSWTWPAVGALLSGHYPPGHGLVDTSHCFLDDALDTLPELYLRKGYVTAAFLGNAILHRGINLDAGFETFLNVPNITARALNDRLLNWIDVHRDAARFAYVHYFDPHAPYLPPPAFLPGGEDALPVEAVNEWGDRVVARYRAGTLDPAEGERFLDELRRRYDGEAAYLDHALGNLLDALATRGELANTLIVFTSDHGEEFLEHGGIDHGPHLYEESLRVPLCVTGFGRAALDPRIDPRPVETRRVFETLRRLSDLPAPARQSPGRGLLDPRTDPLFAFTSLAVEPGVKGRVEKFSLFEKGRKLIFTPATDRLEMYDLTKDPGEQKDLARRLADHGLKLRTRLESLRRAVDPGTITGMKSGTGKVQGASDEMKARLEALGYPTGR